MTPHLRREPLSRVPGFVKMQYLIYLAVATPLLLGWLFWESAHLPPPPPMFHSFADDVHDAAVLQRQAENTLRQRAAQAEPRPPERQAARATPQRLQRTARAATNDSIRLR